MSLGTLFAFISYKEQFSSRVSRVIDSLVDYKMLGISIERLSDILLTQPEEDDSILKIPVPDDLTLRVSNLSFRYAAGEPQIVDIKFLEIFPGKALRSPVLLVAGKLPY